MNDEEKELQKLTANWINGMAIGSFTAGVVTPLVGYKFGLIHSSPDNDIWSNSAIWFVASVCAHIAAYVTLLGYGEP